MELKKFILKHLGIVLKEGKYIEDQMIEDKGE